MITSKSNTREIALSFTSPVYGHLSSNLTWANRFTARDKQLAYTYNTDGIKSLQRVEKVNAAFTTTASDTYTYNSAGRPTRVNYSMGTNTVIVGNDYYSNNRISDVIRQLLRDSTSGIDLNEAIHLAYNDNGDLQSQTSTYKQISGQGAQPGPVVNRPTQFDTAPGGRVTEDLQYSYIYDAEGNMTQRTAKFQPVTIDDQDSRVTLTETLGLSPEAGVYPISNPLQRYGGAGWNDVGAQVKFGAPPLQPGGADRPLQPGEYDLWITWKARATLGTGHASVKVKDDYTDANPQTLLGIEGWGWGMVTNPATGMLERAATPAKIDNKPIAFNVDPKDLHSDGLRWFHVGTVHLDSPGLLKLRIDDDQGAIAFDAFKITPHVAQEVIKYDYANRPVYSQVFSERTDESRLETFYAYDAAGHMVATRNVDRLPYLDEHTHNLAIEQTITTVGYAYQGAQQLLSFGLDDERSNDYLKIKNFNLIGTQGNVLAYESTQQISATSTGREAKTVWQFNNLDGSKFVDSQGWSPNDYAFAGQKLQSTSTDFLIQSRDARRTWNGADSGGSAFWAGSSAFVGSIGNSFLRFGNGLAQMGANAIDTGMIGVNAATTLAGMRWQYNAIGTLGQAVEAGEVSTGDIAYNVGVGLGTLALDTVSLGGFAAIQYYTGAITAEEAGDRFIGLGLTALGGAGALRAAGLGAMTVSQAGKIAVQAARHPVASIRGIVRQEGAQAPVSGVGSLVNGSSRATHGYGVNWFRSSRIRSLMGTTDEGRAVLNAAESGRINLTFEAGMNVPKRLYGEMVSGAGGAPNEAIVYLLRTQNGRNFSLLGRSVDGYSHSAATGIHEGLHALGISGSGRAEALVRLAELKMHGVAINRTAIRQVLTDMRAAGEYGSRMVRPDGSLGRTMWDNGWTRGIGNMEFKVVY